MMFDFFKKKKTPTEPLSEEPERSETAAPVTDRVAPDKAFFQQDDYIVSLKHAAMRFLNDNAEVFEAERVFNMITAVIDVEDARGQLESAAWRQAKNMIAKGGDEAERIKRLVLAETALRIDGVLARLPDEAIDAAVTEATDVETLVKAFIAIDYGSFALKPEASVHLRFTEQRIVEELRRRGVVVKGPFENLRDRLHAAVKDNAGEQQIADIMKQLYAVMCERPRMFLAIDGDFGDRFAHIAYDGRAEMFSTRELAEKFAAFCDQQHLGHVSVRDIPREELGALMERLYRQGIDLVRLDNGRVPVELRLDRVLTLTSGALIDDAHRETRGCLLREMEYGCRIGTCGLSEDDAKMTVFKGNLLVMRLNAYRLLGRGLLYVLMPHIGKDRVSYYTKAALAQAKSMLEKRSLSSKALLFSEEDDAYAVYDGPMRLRVVQREGDTSEQSLVCAFTELDAANETAKRFSQNGANDVIVAVTWDELQREATQCAGVMLDLPTYGRQLKKQEFAEVVKCRAYDAPIVMKIKAAKESALKEGKEHV